MKKTYLLVLAAALAVALVALVGCSASTPATPAASTGSPATSSGGSASASVSISNFAFSPADLTVKVGQAVTWTNNDTVTHTVTSDTGAFQSGQLAQGATYSFTFSKAGTYAYHCSIHPQMTAKITVQ